jgi:hypothetical protein
MAILEVAHVAASSTDGDTVTTGAIDTTGANLLVVYVAYAQGTSPAISDSKSNSPYTALTERNAAASFAGRLHYFLNPSGVGSGHTFTATASSSFPSIYAVAYSGVLAFDQESGAGGSGGSVQPGSLTPPSDGALFVCGLSDSDGSTDTIDLSFDKRDGLDLVGGQAFGGALAHLIQGSAAARNPTWSTGGGNWATAMATFTASVGANNKLPWIRA